MPWSGGAFTRTNGVHTGATLWVQDRDAGTKILAARHDTHDQDLAGGINSTLEKSGSNAATGNLNIGSNRLTAVADGTAKTDAATVNQLQSNAPAFQATDTGTANAHVIALSPAITAYAAGQAITFKSNNASTTTSTVNVNGLGVKTIKKKHDKNIEAGDIEDGSIVTVVYDGTNFQMTSQAATDEGLDLGAVSGIIESNANFVDMCIVGPSVDGVSWNGHFSKASVWTSLMLATVETSGSDAQVNIWDLTAGTLASATPLATLTLSGATPTSIAASMGYLIVGTSDQGTHICDPHGGAWAERTDGWPRSLTTSGAPVLVNVNISHVAAGMSAGCGFDPRTGGKIPNFAVGYGAGATAASLVKWDGNVYDETAYTSTASSPVVIAAGMIFLWRDSGERFEGTRIDLITADFSPAGGHFDPNLYPTVGVVHDAAPTPDGHLLCFAEGFHQSFGLFPGVNPGSQRPSSLQWFVNRTYTTGLVGNEQKLVALANSVTADRSGKSNTLTQNGTVTEAVVASGTELKGYNPSNTSSYLSRAYDADFNFAAGFSISFWAKATFDSSQSIWVDRQQAGGGGDRILVYKQSDDKVRFSVTDTVGSVTVDSPAYTSEDGVWKKYDCIWDYSATLLRLCVDGVEVGTTASTGVTDLTNGTAILAVLADTPGTSGNVATDTTMSLLRISATILTANQVRRSYEAEAPMFAVNAKCLLQSGSTDAVLDAEIDPLSGKVIVTQTDSQEIFDGLAIETERTVATGGSTFEHGLLWGDAVAEINNANLFASTPATDQRVVNEMVRSLSADLPAGVDLGKAKAWGVVNQTSFSVLASFNIESVTDESAGRLQWNFAVPFKNTNYAVQVSAYSSGNEWAGLEGTPLTKYQARTITRDVISGPGNPTDVAYHAIVCFGELENE